MTARRASSIAAVVVLGGVAAGVVGAAVTWLLHAVHWLAFAAATEFDLASAPRWRRVVAPVVGGALGGVGWWWLRARVRLVSANHAACEPGRYRMGLVAPIVDAVLQIITVAAGASMGREGAPRQASSAVVEGMALRAGVDERWRGLLVGAAAGAGLAAVYNVPLAGAVFALEIVLARPSWRAALVAVPMAVIATVVGWLAVGSHPVYVFPATALTWTTAGWVLLVTPAITAVGLAFDALTRPARQRRPPPGWRLPAAIALAGLVLGLLALWRPELLGNGLAQTQFSFSDAELGWPEFLALGLLKPLVTALFFAAGAEGGRLTPALATGAALGAAAVLWRHGDLGALAVAVLVTAVGVLAVSQRAPVFAGVFGWELTDCPAELAALLVTVSVLTHLLAAAARRTWRRRPPPAPAPRASPA